jgi:hypothetical protein
MKNLVKIYIAISILIEKTGEKRMPALSNQNRAVNLRHVSRILGAIKAKGYRKSAPVQTIPAEEAVKYGITKLFDMNGNLIPPESYHLYFLIIEGQHRCFAVSLYNEWLISKGENPIDVPAIEIELNGEEALAEYLSEINMTQKEWTKEDYLRGAANLNTDDDLLQKYQELIKTDSNPNGFSLSSLNLIYCNNSGALSKTDFILLCTGVKTKGRSNKDIIPGYDIETGDMFINLCDKAGFRKSEIAKRYLITEFNNIRNTAGGANLALNVFNSITKDDADQMLNIYEHLDEEKVIYQIKVVKERYQASLVEVEESEAA